MATDGAVSLWGVNGPVVWHSETSGLGYWYAGGTKLSITYTEAAAGKPAANVIWIG